MLPLLAAALVVSTAGAKQNCPLYGTQFPKPRNLLQDAGVQYAARLLDDLFPKYIDNENTTGSDHFSYSVEVFSGSEDEPLWEHHWTAPNLRTMNTTGTRKISGDTVYRIGSITKIYTMLTFLATVGDAVMNEPIAKYLPEIEELARNGSESDILTPDWEDITVGSLATQMSGLIRDYSILGELAYQLPMESLYQLGFPPVPITQFPPCGYNPTCNRTQLFTGLGKLPPSFAPYSTPVYSDLGFTLLAFIAEKITGRGFKTLMKEAVLDPLGLRHTFISKPSDSLGVIPGDVSRTSWAGDLGEEWATGNMYTSSRDLSNLGRAIMRSTLLRPAMTRRWMKPFSFTSDPKAMVGMPWGVRRIELTQHQNSSYYQFTHTYNKAGSLGSYYTLFALLPDLDVGYSILVAGQPPPGLTMDMAEALTAVYVPTLMYAARTQANATFGGTYRYTGNLTTGSNSTAAYNATLGRFDRRRRLSANDTAPARLNSTVTITADADVPGLGVANWFSNGTDMSLVAAAIGSNTSSDYFDRMRPSIRLYPAGLEDKTPDGGRRVAFKAVFEDLSLPEKNASYATDCATWVGVTAVVYGSRPLDLFIFEMDKNGTVQAVENAALRLRMDRVG